MSNKLYETAYLFAEVNSTKYFITTHKVSQKVLLKYVITSSGFKVSLACICSSLKLTHKPYLITKLAPKPYLITKLTHHPYLITKLTDQPYLITKLTHNALLN